jgi:phage gpG-like protein
MDIKEFSKLIRAKQKEIDTLMRRKMPIRVGNMAKRHFQDNFRKSGFVDGGLHPWPKTKRQLTGSTSAAGKHGPLLSSRNHLFNAVRYVPGDYRVKIVNDVPYAPIHNWGGETKPAVTPKMRRFAWAMYYQAAGKSKKGTKGRKSPERRTHARSTDVARTGSDEEEAPADQDSQAAVHRPEPRARGAHTRRCRNAGRVST